VRRVQVRQYHLFKTLDSGEGVRAQGCQPRYCHAHDNALQHLCCFFLRELVKKTLGGPEIFPTFPGAAQIISRCRILPARRASAVITRRILSGIYSTREWSGKLETIYDG